MKHREGAIALDSVSATVFKKVKKEANTNFELNLINIQLTERTLTLLHVNTRRITKKRSLLSGFVATRGAVVSAIRCGQGEHYAI